MTVDVSDVIRFISDRIGDYEKPESLQAWVEKAMKKLPSCRYALLGRKSESLSRQLGKELNQIEKLEGFSLMEKLQLVFIFSRPVSDEFVQMLKDANFEISQDEEKRINRFSTEDGSVVRFSGHIHHQKCFEGVFYPVGRKRRAPEVQGLKEEAGASGNQGIKRKSRSYQQEDVREEAFNGPIDYDELDKQEWVNPGFPKRVKMEYEVPATQTKISVISLVAHIETIATYFDLESLQNKTLSVAKLNSLIDALLICIEENRIRRNDTSIPLKSILKHLQLYLIRPLGSEEALESITQKIQEIGGNNDEVPPTLIGELLNFLLISIGFCAQLD
ncbi:hypothetical protein B9Z55_021188 [Caenorhabditis nigoni]|uniref:SPK domain-containing protein n=1 Tax=Caenorhabditis nigoni TaxID=1611254 RepID=A0A2G5TQV9_9PELO|nr:hypothetical protein B9Z55_021188 [Caenorhabditis nigoni]